MDEDGSFSTADVLNAPLRLMYLLTDNDDNLIRVLSTIVKFFSEASILQCTSDVAPKMIKISEYSPNPEDERARAYYEVSFKLNELDTLNVFEIVHYFNLGRIVANVRVTPVIERSHYIKLAEQYEFEREYKRGSFYQTKEINFTELYAPEYQKASFQKHYQISELTKKYFSGNNSLVIGQLVFAEDMLYAAEHLSTYFYENTVPIWKSVYEGNWKSVGKVIRTLVDESVKDMQVYASHFENFDVFPMLSEPWVLGNDASSQDFLAVPRLLVRAAVDVNNRRRGMVFHTYNDPYLHFKEESDKFCFKTADCQEFNPQFKNFTMGYTFCCYPEDSLLLKEML